MNMAVCRRVGLARCLLLSQTACICGICVHLRDENSPPLSHTFLDYKCNQVGGWCWGRGGRRGGGSYLSFVFIFRNVQKIWHPAHHRAICLFINIEESKGREKVSAASTHAFALTIPKKYHSLPSASSVCNLGGLLPLTYYAMFTSWSGARLPCSCSDMSLLSYVCFKAGGAFAFFFFFVSYWLPSTLLSGPTCNISPCTADFKSALSVKHKKNAPTT